MKWLSSRKGVCGGTKARKGRGSAWMRWLSSRKGVCGGTMGRKGRGSAAVELVLLLPFVLLLMAAIWDIRAFTAYRTDIAREMYAVAELFGGGGQWTDAALRNAMQAAQDRLSASSAGWMRVVVVGRRTDITPAGGTDWNGDSDFSNDPENSDGQGCDVDPDPAVDADGDGDPANDRPFCDPMLLREVRPSPDPSPADPIYWRGNDPTTNECVGINSQLPAWNATPANRVFGPAQRALPREDLDPATGALLGSHREWVSRSLVAEEWWVVVEICSHFGGGGARPVLLGGGIAAFGLRAMDVSLTMYNRVAWGGQVPIGECNWCRPP